MKPRRPSYDALIIGSGIAGLFAALRLAESGSVALTTKAALEESNTRYAQGGIAAVMFDDDDIELHIADTLAAGAGLCIEEAVRVLCSEGPDRIRDLLRIGVAFDRDATNALARGMEAAHSRQRVLHAGGDATGSHIEIALAAAVRFHKNIDVFEHAFLTDLLVEESTVVGAKFLTLGPIHADMTVLASGGAGQVYRHTTNPLVSTGDGVAAAHRAGAVISDAEFFQFHPTALAVPETFLISEAVRGEGAVLRNVNGSRFVDELAPRDVVARAIQEQMAQQDGQPVYLDATAFDGEFLAKRFPSIDAACKAHQIDWSKDLVPVTPAAHYWMGGVHTDLWGRTSLAGLYACGEVAHTGVHGANRLASNSLLEGLVFANRIAERPASLPSISPQPVFVNADARYASMHIHKSAKNGSKMDVQELMWNNVGLVRDKAGLTVAFKQLEQWSSQLETPATQAEWELYNLITVGQLITDAALQRTESRGAHYRSDFPC